MIEINLIPDVKREYLRAERMRNLVVSVSIIAGLAALGIVLLVGLLLLGQVAREKIAQGQIDSEYKKLSEVKDLSDLVTIQNQLSKISSINSSRSVDSRLFDVLSAVNPKAPNDVKYTSVKLDPSTNTLSVEGTATGGYSAVETLKKTITNATFRTTSDGATSDQPLVSDIQIGSTSFGVDSSGQRVVTFTLTMTYAQGLFDNTVKDARVVVPTGSINVTDSRTRVPDSLFTTNTVQEDKGDQ